LGWSTIALVVTALGCRRPPPIPEAKISPADLTSVELTYLAGRTIDAKELAGKVILVNYFSPS
jgi:hypothetical protein